MQRSLEQRYAIKFCVKLGKSATETFDMIKQAYPDVALARSGVFRWHQAFLEGREEVADEDRAGRPSTSTNTDNVTRVRKVLNTDRRLSIRLIAQMSIGSDKTRLTPPFL
ncbi:protein GVQW3-like [Diorhabda carinulata]|uniref:protein GVQW3-like n=1 Tax=Diorhabda carinulata TaxID=1163345 RepID=UPI0025A0E370|nr:protein GVQW3-like [Diorhabda carinulata]